MTDKQEEQPVKRYHARMGPHRNEPGMTPHEKGAWVLYKDVEDLIWREKDIYRDLVILLGIAAPEKLPLLYSIGVICQLESVLEGKKALKDIKTRELHHAK